LQKLNPKLVTEGLRMLRREINTIKLQEKDSPGELKKKKKKDKKSSKIFCHVEWEKVYTNAPTFVTEKLKQMIPNKVQTEDFELTWILRREASKLNLEFNKKLELIISICQVLWRTGIEQQSSLYKQLLALTAQETNHKIKDLVSHFQVLLNQRKEPKDGDLFDVSETRASPEFKFRKMIQKELKREGSSFETLYNILRFYEQEHRNKSISGALRFNIEPEREPLPEFIPPPRRRASPKKMIIPEYNMNVPVKDAPIQNIDIHAGRKIVNDWENRVQRPGDYLEQNQQVMGREMEPFRMKERILQMKLRQLQ
jgi:hypothetical protein